MAAWAPVHETDDESWKADVELSSCAAPDKETTEGPETSVEGPSAMLGGKLDELGSEVSELRGRLGALQATLDELLAGDGDE